MIFPLKELVEFTGNIYELTCASTHRAYQLAALQMPNLQEDTEDKVVSRAAEELFLGEINYQIEYQGDLSQ